MQLKILLHSGVEFWRSLMGKEHICILENLSNDSTSLTDLKLGHLGIGVCVYMYVYICIRVYHHSSDDEGIS